MEHDRKRAAKRDAAPGQKEAGMDDSNGAQMDRNIVMPSFPLPLGKMLMQHTGYNEIDVLAPGSEFLRQDMSDSEITQE